MYAEGVERSLIDVLGCVDSARKVYVSYESIKRLLNDPGENLWLRQSFPLSV